MGLEDPGEVCRVRAGKERGRKHLLIYGNYLGKSSGSAPLVG
jgi:hypothetical protein